MPAARTLPLPRSPLGCALLTALCYGLLGLLLLWRAGWEPTGFACLGETFAVRSADGTSALGPSARILPGHGYDGQFFLALARAPLAVLAPGDGAPDPTAGGVRLDAPAYRTQRILYPLTAWALTLGQPEAAAWSLIAVNWLALAALAAIGGALARHWGLPAWWGALLAFYPGHQLSFVRDLAEPLTALLLAGATLLLVRGKEHGSVWGATLLLSLAVLSRETAALLPLAVFFCGVWQRRRDLVAAGLLPLTVLALWQALLWQLWGQPPWAAGGGNLGWPLLGLGQTVLDNVRQLPLRSLLLYIAQLLCLGLYVLGGLWAGLRTWPRATPAGPLRRAWVLALGLVACLTPLVWVEGWAFLRGASELCLFSALLMLAVPRNPLRGAVLFYAVLLWVGQGARLVFFE